MIEFLAVNSKIPKEDAAQLPNAVYREATKSAGEQMFGLLLAEETWIHGRVETIDMLSTQFLRRSVSVDFTVPEGIRGALQIGPTAQWA